MSFRILFAFAGGSGHLEPLAPVARAARARGHTVAFVGRPWMVPKVEEAGFVAFAAGRDQGLTPVRRPLLELDVEREEQAFGRGFARRIPHERAAEIIELCRTWRPDVVVWEETDFGAAIAAERLGLPHASVLVTAAGSFVRSELVAEPLAELRAEHALPPDPALTMLSRYLVLSPVPPSYRDPGFPLPRTAHSFRPVAEPAAEPAPPWLADVGSDRPVVYVTLGTVFNVESGDLFSRVLAGVGELPVDVVVTVGRDVDPGELHPQPPNVHVERYVPQAHVLPRCSLVVSHGGSGSVLGALTYGLPMVLIPMGADQPHNARRCEALGVARVLDAMRATPNEVRDAVAAVLADATYTRAAEHLRDELAALPGPDHAVMLLERLAAERRPIPQEPVSDTKSV